MKIKFVAGGSHPALAASVLLMDGFSETDPLCIADIETFLMESLGCSARICVNSAFFPAPDDRIHNLFKVWASLELVFCDRRHAVPLICLTCRQICVYLLEKLFSDDWNDDSSEAEASRKNQLV